MHDQPEQLCLQIIMGACLCKLCSRICTPKTGYKMGSTSESSNPMSHLTATVPLARVFSSSKEPGAHHGVGDLARAVSSAIAAGQDGDLDLLELVGLIAAGGESAPAGHDGLVVDIVLGGVSGQTGGLHLSVEGDLLLQFEDGEVAVDGVFVVVGILDDLLDGKVLGPVVALGGVVLPEPDIEARGLLSVGAVSGGHDVPVGDDGSSTEDLAPFHEGSLVGVLVLGGLSAAHDAVAGVDSAADTGA